MEFNLGCPDFNYTSYIFKSLFINLIKLLPCLEIYFFYVFA